MKHTSWKVELRSPPHSADAEWLIVRDDGVIVAIVDPHMVLEDCEEVTAVIAASPELLAEAQRAVEALDGFLAKGPGFPLSEDGICSVIRSLERAIAKAEGST